MECCLLAVQHPQSGVGGRGPRWLYSPGGDGKPLPWSDSQPLSHRGREEVGNHSPRTVSVCKWPDRIVFPSSRAVFSLVQWGFGNFGFWARFVLLLLTRVPSLMLVCGSCWPARQCGHRIPNDGAGGQARSLRVCHHECSRWIRWWRMAPPSFLYLGTPVRTTFGSICCRMRLSTSQRRMLKSFLAIKLYFTVPTTQSLWLGVLW